MTTSLGLEAVTRCWRSRCWSGCGGLGFRADVRALFTTPVLCELAAIIKVREWIIFFIGEFK